MASVLRLFYVAVLGTKIRLSYGFFNGCFYVFTAVFTVAFTAAVTIAITHAGIHGSFAAPQRALFLQGLNGLKLVREP
jgi:uncharacterized membrane protein